MTGNVEKNDIVYCLSDVWEGQQYTQLKDYSFPVKGTCYTVREVVTFNGKSGLRLAEIVNSTFSFKEGNVEIAFDAKQFKKVKKPSIECFNKLLEKPTSLR